jgi:hypothetical protein
MSHLTVASVRLTLPETDHAARIVEALRAKGGLSYPQIARQLGYASHAQLVRLVKHRKRISRAKYEVLVRWSNGELPTTPPRNHPRPTPTRGRAQEERRTKAPGQTRARTSAETRSSGARAARSPQWARWAGRLQALPAVIATTMLRGVFLRIGGLSDA